MFQEFDERKEAKKRAEYITPDVLRRFIVDYVHGEELSVLDPAIGSGQLLEHISHKVKRIDGYDVSSNVEKPLKINFGDKCTFHNKSFIQAGLNKCYDYSISNYPFSLKLKDNPEDSTAVLNDAFLKQFYNKNATGVMDFLFILKSFNVSKKGVYLCFPGIGYRTAERKFREYVIKNNYLVEYGLLEGVNFEHTSISILFMLLSKEKTEKGTKSFYKNFKNDECEEKQVNTFDDNYTLEIPKKAVLVDYADFDAVETEKQARRQIEEMIMKQLKFSQVIGSIDESVKNGVESVDEWIEHLYRRMKKCIT